MSPNTPAETAYDDATSPLLRLGAVLAVRFLCPAAPQTVESVLKPFHNG